MSNLREQIEREKEEFDRNAAFHVRMQRAVRDLPLPPEPKVEQAALDIPQAQGLGNGWASLTGARVPWYEQKPTQKQISYLGSLTRKMRNVAEGKGWLEVMDVIDEVKRPTKRGKASDLIDCFQNLLKEGTKVSEQDVLKMIDLARSK